jgi:hypothetical protein
VLDFFFLKIHNPINEAIFISSSFNNKYRINITDPLFIL